MIRFAPGFNAVCRASRPLRHCRAGKSSAHASQPRGKWSPRREVELQPAVKLRHLEISSLMIFAEIRLPGHGVAFRGASRTVARAAPALRPCHRDGLYLLGADGGPRWSLVSPVTAGDICPASSTVDRSPDTYETDTMFPRSSTVSAMGGFCCPARMSRHPARMSCHSARSPEKPAHFDPALDSLL